MASVGDIFRIIPVSLDDLESSKPIFYGRTLRQDIEKIEMERIFDIEIERLTEFRREQLVSIRKCFMFDNLVLNRN